MEPAPDSAPASTAAPPSRWARVVHQDREAMRELAASYWYCAYAWLRRADLDPARVAMASMEAFSDGVAEPDPENAASPKPSRLREWLPVRLREIITRDFPSPAEPPSEVDAAWAEKRYAEEPAGEPDTVFHRRWALTVLEFSMETVREEYATAGQESLFAEVAPFIGFEGGDDEHYKTAAENLGLTAGAARKAVFEFRRRHREVLRAFVGDTLLDPADIDREITALLCVCDAPGASPSVAPLPEAIRRLNPEQLLARAMHSVRMTSGGAGLWTPPSNEEVAHLFPQYEMRGMIGRGGMGAIYQARQVSLDRFVAIKLLPLEVSVDEEYCARFVREAQTMARLSHPNIIAVHDFGKTSEGHLYFVMEYIEGENLHDIIHGGRLVAALASGTPPGPLTPARSLEIISGICDALHYAHGKGVIHRDIKPANVIVDSEGRVKVADFGLARRVDLDPDARGRTTVGAIVGTPDYMAPEQMRGISVDQRADIFSVGVALYEILCQEVPRGVFTPPSRRLGVDVRIDDILTKAMQQEPERRYQDSLEMKADVDRILLSPAPAAAWQPVAKRGSVHRDPVSPGKEAARSSSAEAGEIGHYSFLPVAAPGSHAGKEGPAGPDAAPPDAAQVAVERAGASAPAFGEHAPPDVLPKRRSRFALWLGLAIFALLVGAAVWAFLASPKALDFSKWLSRPKPSNDAPSTPAGPR